MLKLEAGDVVRLAWADDEMVIIGCADDEPQTDAADEFWFCVWEAEHRLFEEVFCGKDLMLVQKERRRIPRGGHISFPVRCTSDEHERISLKT